MSFIYQAELWCDECGQEIANDILEKGKVSFNIEDETSYDSDQYPKAVCSSGESDSPNHCAAREDCLEAIELNDGSKIGALLTEDLTDVGVQYVKEAVMEGPDDSVAVEVWKKVFDWIEFDIDPDKLDEFTKAYIDCALWSTNDESNEQGGDPLDNNYEASDISQETLKEIVEDCEKFQKENEKDIENWKNSNNLSTNAHYSGKEMAGHDFWLTRNGHGAGFWDGDWKEEDGKRLTKACDVFGEVNLYVGDSKMRKYQFTSKFYEQGQTIKIVYWLGTQSEVDAIDDEEFTEIYGITVAAAMASIDGSRNFNAAKAELLSGNYNDSQLIVLEEPKQQIYS